jgi:probable F420-dependent oxidoreductase
LLFNFGAHLTVKYGLSIIIQNRSIRPDVLGREAEARGFESLWITDHSYIPVEAHEGHKAHQLSPKTGSGDAPTMIVGEAGEKADTRFEFRYCLEALTSMGAALCATTKLNVASGMCILTERDPLTTAKAISSLDYLSGGRVIFGVGAGWHAVEMANHGTVFKQRYALLRERVLAIRAIWANDQAEYSGKYVNIARIWTHPRPVQQPHPPIIAGFDGPTAIQRMIEWSDGWCPTQLSLPDLPQKIETVRGYLRDAGRDPLAYPISLFYNNAWISTDVNKADMDQLEQLGVGRVVLNLPPAESDQVLPVLDKYAKLLG